MRDIRWRDRPVGRLPWARLHVWLDARSLVLKFLTSALASCLAGPCRVVGLARPRSVVSHVSQDRAAWLGMLWSCSCLAPPSTASLSPRRRLPLDLHGLWLSSAVTRASAYKSCTVAWTVPLVARTDAWNPHGFSAWRGCSPHSVSPRNLTAPNV